MDIIYNLTDSFQCKSDRKVKSWSISFDPEGAYNIAISTDGVLQFNNYNPIEKLTYIYNISIKIVLKSKHQIQLVMK